MELHVLGNVYHEVLVLVGPPQELVKAMIFVVLIVLPILLNLLPLAVHWVTLAMLVILVVQA